MLPLSAICSLGAWLGAAHRPVARAGTVACSATDIAALNLTPQLEKTVKAFQAVPDQKLRCAACACAAVCTQRADAAWAARRYQQLLFFAKKLAPMDAALQVPENKVPGCLSVVYVHATGRCMVFPFHNRAVCPLL